MTKYELNNTIMQNEISDITKKLISFKTVTGNNEEVAACFEFIKNYFSPETASGKIIVKEYDCNEYQSMVFSNADTLKYDIILNGHIDVVSAEDKDFTPREEKGKLCGRGAADMKSQVAIMMAVLKELVAAGTERSIALMLISDEEIGGKCGTKYLLNEVGYRSKIAIIPDGGENFCLNVKEKGILWIKITSRGKAAHGSQTWLGENAIVKLMDFYKKLDNTFPPLKKIKSQYQDGISVNLGKISGGKSINSIPDFAEMYLDIRYSEKSDKKKIIRAVGKLAKYYKMKFEIVEDGSVGETDPKNHYLKNFKKIAEKNIGKKMRNVKSTGSSDARFFSEKNIPVIITSPDYGNIHTSNEWIEIKGVVKLYETLKEFLISIN